MNQLFRNHLAQDSGAVGGSLLLAAADVVARWDSPQALITVLGLALLIVRAVTELVRVAKSKGEDRGEE